MNLSESSIAHLEKKAFLRGLERAAEITYKSVIKFDRESRDQAWSAALDIQHDIEKEAEKLSVELGEMEEA